MNADREAAIRPNIEAPLIVWEYVSALERLLDAAREQLHDISRKFTLAEEDARIAREQNRLLREALREACLHQGLPEDAPPERVAAHFRNNREFREGFDALDTDGEQT